MKYLLIFPLIIACTGCIPKIEVAPPKEPVTINMNVKIDHDIHIKADDQIKALLEREHELFPSPPQAPEKKP